LHNTKCHCIGGGNIINLCEEAPVELIVNGKKYLTFMCTPSNLNELAAGHLYSSGLIEVVNDIYTLAACDDMRKISIQMAKNIDESGFQLNNVLASSCGSGPQFNERFFQRPKNESSYTISLTKLKELSIEMFSSAELYKKHGGVHCAALSDGNEILALREDVGRHNAVDKVIGKGVFLETDFKNSIIMTTGRISTDMILKAVNAGIPIIASRSIPTTMAYEIAEKLGITIVGRIVSKNPVVYTHEERIKN
jgi:FdhD protein